MMDRFSQNPSEWRHMSYGEYMDYGGIFDVCACSPTCQLAIYVKHESTDFLVACANCDSFVMAKTRVEAMVMWNRKCRYKRGIING